MKTGHGVRTVLFILLFCFTLSTRVFAIDEPPDFTSHFTHFNLKDYNDFKRISDLNFSGKLLKAVGWIDEAGDNILLFTEQKQVSAEPDGPVDSSYSKFEVFVYHYVETDGILRLRRLVYDYMSGCEVKPESGFTFDSLSVTDVDDNGIGEVSFVYKLLCSGEHWGGSQVKLLMLENGQKYALRSEARMQQNTAVSGSASAAGTEKNWDYIVDDMYEQAPPDFLKYSQLCWAEFGNP